MEQEQQAIGIKTALTDEILSELRSQNIANYKRKAYPRRIMYDIPRDKFMEQLRICGSAVMASMGESEKFEYNPETTRIAEQLYLYTIGSEKFDGDLKKGIALVGDVGCGKTVIMTGYIHFLQSIHDLAAGGNDYKIPYLSTGYVLETASALYRKFTPETINECAHGIMFIDELGREPKFTKIYGVDAFPIGEILFERHRHGSITHITSNLTLTDLSEPDMYGAILGDRFKQMFNFIVMKGKSRRE